MSLLAVGFLKGLDSWTWYYSSSSSELFLFSLNSFFGGTYAFYLTSWAGTFFSYEASSSSWSESPLRLALLRDMMLGT
jgi:hypothetical protein